MHILMLIGLVIHPKYCKSTELNFFYCWGFSTKVKYYAMVSTTNEIVLFCWLLVDMVVYLSCLTPMYYDKKSIVQIAQLHHL